ncbi:MAG TPA: hypothetical protein PLU39_05805 [Armatimonadota bacterium]|nr:hypothetical protein [Armatimonadota bacterium]
MAVKEQSGAVRPVDSGLTGRVKEFALSQLGADLVGIANIERFENAPLRMSPQGILPSARSVVVMALHHPDACIEMGGIEHPQVIGPYRVQYWMNTRLDEISYRMGLFLEKEGYAAVPIVSSNIWRYKGYKDLTAHFAPDISHIYAAVTAGLADLGYSGLAITPEYGARQRYVTVITDAPLQPTPLLEPGSVCDMCKLCVKHCLSKALSKEVDGLDELWIEGKKYTKASKNLWRCAWGEHFDLDLDLPIPDHVNEEVILEQVRIHGFRGGEMGSCLRYCLPKERRYFDSSYTNAPRRKRNTPDELASRRGLEEQVRSLAYRWAADFVMVTPQADLEAIGIRPTEYLPDGQTAVTVGLHFRTPEGADPAAPARQYLLEMAAYDIARALERQGYSAVCDTAFPEKSFQTTFTGVKEGWSVQTATVITAAPLEPTSRELPQVSVPAPTPEETRAQLKRLLHEWGADLASVVPAERLAALHPQLAALFDGVEVLVARDRSPRMREYDPEVHTEVTRTRAPEDHLKGARSVIVVGLRLPRASVERTALPPAEAVGPYAFAQYESVKLLRNIGYRAIRWLEDRGYRATMSFDLCGTGSVVANPRGEQPDAFCNRFTAVAAGLGHLGKGGFVITPEFGPNVRFVAIVTDAPIAADPIPAEYLQPVDCGDCRRCLDACHTCAFQDEATVEVNGVAERFYRMDRNRCDWAKRYSLVGEEGVKYVGWEMNVPLPEKIDAEALAEGLRQQPPIPKHRPCNFETCVLACPYSR